MDWTAPDVSAPAAPPPPTGPVPPARRPVAPTMRRLAPMTTSDILDGSFALLRRAPKTVLAFTAVFVIPAELLGAYVVRNVTAGADLISAFESGDASLLASDSSSNTDTGITILASLAPSLALVFVAAGLTRLVSAWHTGRELALGELLRGSLRYAAPLLGSWALVKVAEGIGLLLFVLPALAVMAWFLVTVPAIVAEDLGAVEGMRRSARLVSRRFWPVLGIGILSALVATFLSYAIEAIPLFLVWVTGIEGYGWFVAGLTSAATALLTTPVVAGAAVLAYLDLRVRTEGLDLELDAVDAFAAAP